jgi:uncharacterized membrane protein
MAENLIVVGFHGKHRAAEVLGQLEQLTDAWALDLKDGVAAYRTDDGRLRIDQSVQPTTKEGAGWGVFIGSMIGALLAAPFTAGLSTAAAASTLGLGAATMGTVSGVAGADDADTFKREYGISDDFVKEAGGMIQPGDSAVFAVIRGGNPQQIAERFRGYGGQILKTTLSPLAAERVQQTIRA